MYIYIHYMEQEIVLMCQVRSNNLISYIKV